MLVSCLLFACMGVCVKLGSDSLSTGEIVLYRGAISMLMTITLARIHRISLRTPRWRIHVSRSISGSVALSCYFFAIGSLPLATAVTLNYTSPLWVAVLLALFFGERLRLPAMLSMACGFAGVVLLLRPTLSHGQWLGAVAGLSSGAVASIAYLSVHELGRAGEPVVRTVFWFSLVTTLFGLSGALYAGMDWPDGRELALLLGVGLFGGLAQLAMTQSYSYGHAMISANLSYTTVVFASLFGMLLWQELMPWLSWIGIALIIGSAIAISLRPRSAAAAAPAGGERKYS